MRLTNQAKIDTGSNYERHDASAASSLLDSKVIDDVISLVRFQRVGAVVLDIDLLLLVSKKDSSDQKMAPKRHPLCKRPGCRTAPFDPFERLEMRPLNGAV